MPTTIGPGPKYYEILDGVRYDKVSPKRTHAIVQLSIATGIRALAGARGDVGLEWEFRVGDVDGTSSILQPDVSFASRERLDALPETDREIPPFSPDVAIEIRSPSSRAGLRARKTTRYLATGAVLVLDVDPVERVIHAHARDGVRTYENGRRFEHPAVQWLSFDVREVFADLDVEDRSAS
ncbi:MAG: Uma2 family endonuclease [Candidatus Eremiobacteraeota bacterium]|nr:Uma2 family endonuclease [Candidatus Eremiobacteraeota bacterium]